MPLSILRKSAKAARWVREMGIDVTSRHILARFLEDRTLLGRLVEIGGNRARLAGMSFDVASPVIDTRLKSRFLIGSWELETRYLVERHLARELPLVELGGCIGAVSCIANRRLRDPVSHVVVEANEHLIPILESNRERNGCRFRVVHAAIAYGSDEVTFYLPSRFNEGRTLPWKKGTTITTPATSLGAILDREGWERVSLVVDIEGAEVDLVRYEGKVLQDRVERIIVETHGKKESSVIHGGLHRLGFRLLERFGDHAGRNSAWVNSILCPASVAPARPRYATARHRLRRT